ncbi:ABC transporter substrate-binding protein [Pelagibius litoralis]|uniref:ABC transporter substrate-binding protein n=1 Tax=Pelagibius litoralis TaxID=374515 RepID=A0A967KAM2_9PROT|nr:ABC transporter substrate-binding protein [Pelagibius litoralis]NIA69929.1 ABC transporter substrate-binding protein [Pelagibius litoralis]
MTKAKHPLGRGVSRRRIIKGTASVAALTALGGFPNVLRAQGATVKVGVLHPVTGAIAFAGTQARIGAEMAIEEINKAGGIKSLGGAKLEPVFGDTQGKPEVAATEVDRMAREEIVALIGSFASSNTLATTQAAAKHGIPCIVDVAVSDKIVGRGLDNVFRFSPGFGKCSEDALNNLVNINASAGNLAKTVTIIHEDSLFGSGLAGLLNKRLPDFGFEVIETIAHATPTRDFSNVVTKLRSTKPDLIVPANYYNEYVLLARTMLQQRIQPKAIYSVLGGAASNYRFVKEHPKAAQYIMDCNHWPDPRKDGTQALRQKVEATGKFFTYEVPMNYDCVRLFADALERAASAERGAVKAALSSANWKGMIMPYAAVEFDEKGQNKHARPVNTQIIGDDIEIIFPDELASAKVVYPMPSRG